MRSPRAKWILLWTAGSAGGLAVLSLVGLVFLFWWFGRDIAAQDETALRNYRPQQVTRIQDRRGRVIGEIYSQRRTVVSYDRIPAHVENAFLAAEDADFHRHEGMDYFGMVRALIANVRAGEVRQGASTITQQVVKIFMLSSERTLERKVQELLLARRLERALTKREILELYLNEIYLGHGRYGVEEASRYYFGKGIAEVDLGQAALLAGLPKAPSRDSPFRNPEAAKRRQVYVLQQMVRLGWASARDAQRFIDAPLDLVADDVAGHVEAGAEEFVDLVEAELERRFGRAALDSLGATVTTTVDLDLQRAARAAVRDGLQALDRRQSHGHGNKPRKEEHRRRAIQQAMGELRVGETYPAVVVASPDSSSLPADGFAAVVGDHPVFVRVPEGSRYDDPEKSWTEQFPPDAITYVRVVRLPSDDGKLPRGYAEAEIRSGPEGAVLVADVTSGEVLAMVGGYDYTRGQFNRALAAKRQPGSAFKPFVYGAALLSRRFTAATIMSDSPEIYEKWRPTNFEPDVYRGDIRLRVALTHSVNTVAIKLLDAVGHEAVHEFAAHVGIDSKLAPNLSLALGTSEVTPVELLEGYLTLARGGSHLEPRFIAAIEVPSGTVEMPATEAIQVLGEDVVFVLTSMMQSVVEEGTGAKAKRLARPVAGKTGTSAEHRDAWFAGFTRNHVAVAWVGHDTPKKLGRGETGGRAALPIWLDVMEAAERDVAPQPFVPPPTVSVRTIDARTGLLAPAGESMGGATPNVRLEEYFLAGTEPIDEAVAEALPASDAVLDLYAPAQPILDGEQELAGDADDAVGPAGSRDPHGAGPDPATDSEREGPTAGESPPP